MAKWALGTWLKANWKPLLIAGAIGLLAAAWIIDHNVAYSRGVAAAQAICNADNAALALKGAADTANTNAQVAITIAGDRDKLLTAIDETERKGAQRRRHLDGTVLKEISDAPEPENHVAAYDIPRVRIGYDWVRKAAADHNRAALRETGGAIESDPAPAVPGAR